MPRFLAVLAAAGLSVLLSSCATAPTGSSAETTASPRPTASPTIEATPTPDASEVVAEIVVRADSIEVVALDGSSLDVASIFADRDILVETLTDALDAEPSVTDDPGAQERRAGFIYDWNGLSLYLADGQWDRFAADVTRLEVTAATVNGIAIRTDEDIQVGTLVSDLDPSIEIEQYDDFSYFRIGETTVGTYGDLGPGVDPESPLVSWVAVFADTTAVTRILAPVTNWGV